MKNLEPEEQEQAKKIKLIQAQMRAKNPLKRKQPEGGEDIGMVTSFFEQKLLKSELILQEASRKNNVSIVKRLLEAGVNPDCRNHLDRTPLQWAAATGGMDSIKLLLQYEADLESQDKYGMSSLLWSAWFGHVPAMEFLLACGADPYSVNKQGFNILHCAASQNHRNVLDYILDKLMYDCDLNTGDKKGETALHLACKEGHIKAFEKLLEKAGNLEARDRQGRTALHTACVKGEMEIVEKLLNARADIDARDGQGMTALHLAAEQGHCDVADVILSFRPPPENDEIETETDSAGTLSAMTLSPTSENVKVITDGKENGLVEDNKTDNDKVRGVFGRWLKKSAEPLVQTPSPSPTVEAVTESDSTEENKKVKSTLSDVVSQLMLSDKKLLPKPEYKEFSLKDEPYDLDRRMTAIHIAATLGHVQFVRVLLQHGCNPCVQNKQGNSPLHLAAIHEFRSIISDLVVGGSHINIGNNRLSTPLHLAVEKGSIPSVEELLIHGADTTLLDKTGKSPLQVAARGSFIEIVDMIIKADLNTDKIRLFAPLSNSSPKTRKKIDQEYRRYMDTDLKAKVSYAGPHVYTTVKHPHYDVMKPILFKLAQTKLGRNDWKKLAKHWKFQEIHINAIQHQYTGEHSYREHGFRALCIWFHGLSKCSPTKELHESLVKIGKKNIAESLRREISSECTGEKKKSCMPS